MRKVSHEAHHFVEMQTTGPDWTSGSHRHPWGVESYSKQKESGSFLHITYCRKTNWAMEVGLLSRLHLFFCLANWHSSEYPQSSLCQEKHIQKSWYQEKTRDVASHTHSVPFPFDFRHGRLLVQASIACHWTIGKFCKRSILDEKKCRYLVSKSFAESPSIQDRGTNRSHRWLHSYDKVSSHHSFAIFNKQIGLCKQGHLLLLSVRTTSNDASLASSRSTEKRIATTLRWNQMGLLFTNNSSLSMTEHSRTRHYSDRENDTWSDNQDIWHP